MSAISDCIFFSCEDISLNVIKSLLFLLGRDEYLETQGVKVNCLKGLSLACEREVKCDIIIIN